MAADAAVDSTAIMTIPTMDSLLTPAAHLRTFPPVEHLKLRPAAAARLTRMRCVSTPFHAALQPLGGADFEATDGGYENYIALWWQSQLAAQQGQGGASQAPGTS